VPNATLEVPIDSIGAATLAAPFATRLELCDDLPSEGWSPTWEFVRAARAATDVHLVAMIRPRMAGAIHELVPAAFRTTPALLDACLREIDAAGAAGADSVAVSLLDGDAHVDRDACARLVAAARALGMEAAFLRTFDLLADRERGMRDITELGFVRVVTAGVAGWDASVATLPERLAVLARDAANAARFAAAAGRPPVEVVPGGGVRAANAAEFMRVSPHLHASCRRDGVISRPELEALAAVLGR
jgi:copper homeostasis protein CutC